MTADTTSGPAARLVVLASGRGSNLQALIDACAAGALAAKVVGVWSHTASALALERARRAGIPATFIAPPSKRADAETRAEWERELAERIAHAEPDLIVLAGWMRILGPELIARFTDAAGRTRIVNLHPALPGELPGMDAIVEAFAEAEDGKRRESGVMVHVVVPEVDAGPVLAVERVPIDVAAGLDAFEAAMHAAEHRLLVAAVRDYLARLGTPA